MAGVPNFGHDPSAVELVMDFSERGLESYTCDGSDGSRVVQDFDILSLQPHDLSSTIWDLC